MKLLCLLLKRTFSVWSGQKYLDVFGIRQQMWQIVWPIFFIIIIIIIMFKIQESLTVQRLGPENEADWVAESSTTSQPVPDQDASARANTQRPSG